MALLCVGRDGGVAKQPVDSLIFATFGIAGDRHSGELRVPTYGRHKGQTVFNERQWSAVGVEEVAELERRLGVPLPPGCLGENLRLAGIPRLSKLKPGTRIAFEGGAVLTVSGENQPCYRNGASLAALHTQPELRYAFVKVARGLRGIVGWVEEQGALALGETARVTFGEQPLLPEFEAASPAVLA